MRLLTDICVFAFICTNFSNNCILLAKADTGQPNRLRQCFNTDTWLRKEAF